MEELGLLLAIPGTLLESLVYCGFLNWLKRRLTENLIFAAVVASLALLILFAVEVALLRTFGVVASRELVGPAFYHLHRLCFYLVMPSLANVLMLRGRGFVRRWDVAFLPCWMLNLFAVVVEYIVTEALYGPDADPPII